MRRLALMLLALSALGACATPTPRTAAVCDGKHLRPANPYGSVLAPSPKPGAGPAGASAAPSSSAPLILAPYPRSVAPPAGSAPNTQDPAGKPAQPQQLSSGGCG